MDTGWFEVEQAKTILVEPNEAGKTAVLGGASADQSPKWGESASTLFVTRHASLYNADIQSRRLHDAKSHPGRVFAVRA